MIAYTRWGTGPATSTPAPVVELWTERGMWCMTLGPPGEPYLFAQASTLSGALQHAADAMLERETAGDVSEPGGCPCEDDGA